MPSGQCSALQGAKQNELLGEILIDLQVRRCEAVDRRRVQQHTLKQRLLSIVPEAQLLCVPTTCV